MLPVRGGASLLAAQGAGGDAQQVGLLATRRRIVSTTDRPEEPRMA
jgi:hypothetical protein